MRLRLWASDGVLIRFSNSGQYYGFAAAVGKIGAFVGSYVFPYIYDDGSTAAKGGQYEFLTGSLLAAFSGVIALICLPEVGQDTIDYEDVKFREYLAEHGFDTSKLGLHTESREGIVENEVIVDEKIDD